MSIIKDLYEDGYPEIGEFLEKLIAKESELLKNAPEGHNLKHLYDSPSALDSLIAALVKAENASSAAGFFNSKYLFCTI